jgi:hypothetical protein
VSRPVCVHCGKPYGQRDTTSHQVSWPVGGERPPYKGNGVVVKEGFEHKTASRETHRGVMMASSHPVIRAQQEAQLAAMPEHSEMTATRWVWDGQSWHGGYTPFCTLRCALAYARQAYRASRTTSKKATK